MVHRDPPTPEEVDLAVEYTKMCYSEFVPREMLDQVRRPSFSSQQGGARIVVSVQLSQLLPDELAWRASALRHMRVRGPDYPAPCFNCFPPGGTRVGTWWEECPGYPVGALLAGVYGRGCPDGIRTRTGDAAPSD